MLKEEIRTVQTKLDNCDKGFKTLKEKMRMAQENNNKLKTPLDNCEANNATEELKEEIPRVQTKLDNCDKGFKTLKANNGKFFKGNEALMDFKRGKYILRTTCDEDSASTLLVAPTELVHVYVVWRAGISPHPLDLETSNFPKCLGNLCIALRK